MGTWHHRRTTDLGLRLAGAMLCGLSWLAIRTLMNMRLPPPPAMPGRLAFALAAIGFLCASLGIALIAIGHHLFDRIEISSPWMSDSSLEKRYRTLAPSARPATGRTAGDAAAGKDGAQALPDRAADMSAAGLSETHLSEEAEPATDA